MLNENTGVRLIRDPMIIDIPSLHVNCFRWRFRRWSTPDSKKGLLLIGIQPAIFGEVVKPVDLGKTSLAKCCLV